MKRKDFLLTGLSAVPMLTFPQLSNTKNPGKAAFKIIAGKGRFNESFLYKGKNPNDIKISKRDAHNHLAAFEYIGYEKTGPSLHVHFHQEEIFYIVEGEYRFVVGKETMNANPGDTIFLPRNIPHTWIQLTDSGKLVYFVQPAGKAEEFFRTMNDLKKPPTKRELDDIHAAHGMKIFGPPLKF